MPRNKQDGWKIVPGDHSYSVGYQQGDDFHKFTGVPTKQDATRAIDKLRKRYGKDAERYFVSSATGVPKPGPAKKGLGGSEIDRAFTQARTTMPKTTKKSTKASSKSSAKKSNGSKKSNGKKKGLGQIAIDMIKAGKTDAAIAKALVAAGGRESNAANTIRHHRGLLGIEAPNGKKNGNGKPKAKPKSKKSKK